MPGRSVEHASFTVERRYDAAVARVFAAWSEESAKARWFAAPPEGWRQDEYELDFRVGGRELSVGGPEGGPVLTYTATYWDIVPEVRIVYTYEMLQDDVRASVSLATVTFADEGGRTLLVLTEHGAYFDGIHDPGAREDGMGSLLDRLALDLDTA
jgi:uncharacterized protein YndB with AHSA1/START domain